MKQANKMVIYQVFPRWFGNMKSSLVKNGSKVENGVGKFSDFTPVALSKIKELGTTHIWYTGVINMQRILIIRLTRYEETMRQS